MSRISINNMSFYAFHGCFAEESVIGTNFRVDCEFECDTSAAEQSDNIQDTISYLEVYQVIKQQMEIPSHLLEHVSRRIITAVFENFPSVSYCKVKVYKLNPPLGGKMDSVSVCLESERP